MSTVLKPAVLGVTDWKKLARILPDSGSFPKVDGLLYSNTNINSAPVRISATVLSLGQFLCCNEIFWVISPFTLLSMYSSISLITMKPIPPIIISSMITIFIRGLFTRMIVNSQNFPSHQDLHCKRQKLNGILRPKLLFPVERFLQIW